MCLPPRCSVLSLAFILLLALAGCSTVAKGDHFEQQIAEAMKQKGFDVEVDCPDRIPLGHVDTNRFQCDIAGGGERITVDVILDEKLGMKWQPAAGQAAPVKPAAPAAPPQPDNDNDPWN